MPPYLTRKDNTYYFRQVVPAELRSLIGKREIKRSLGRDYIAAVRECKRFAVEADNRLADARAQFDAIPVGAYSREGIRRTRHVLLTRVTPKLQQEFASLIRTSLLETDQNTRIAGMSTEEFDEYSEHIQAATQALRRQLAMGNVAPMLESTRIFLIGRGYQPEFSADDWRRIAYVMTEATLEAYEAMAARQAGKIVKPVTEEILPSQFEVQNTPAPETSISSTRITWQEIYDVWVKECDRRENTNDSYRAAMKLFHNFCAKSPQEVTRLDVLNFRDFLLNEQGLASSTVANKIGFVGTLISSAQNSAAFAEHLPHNPFFNIKIKTSKRGKSGDKRLPFSDTDLKKIFDSPLYTQEHRPRGGAGEAAVWIPAIAYLTGMRLEEIALLKSRQFLQDAAGNHYVHTEDGKNENSADRDVPLHPSLIQAGVLEYARSCPDRLFPRVKCGNEIQSKAYSKWFGRYLSTLGITAKSKVFHSFRHLFKDLCRNAGLNDSAIDQICGHEPGTVGGKYGSGRRIDVLAELITKITPPVALPLIYAPADAHPSPHLMRRALSTIKPTE
jgi:integrase